MKHPIVRAAALAILTVALTASSALAADGVATLGSPSPEEDPGAATTPSDDPMDGLLDYAACMREHGIDMPDPQMAAGGFVMEIEAPAVGGSDQPMMGRLEDIMGSEFLAADEACSHHLGAMVSDIDPAQEAELMERLLAHAQCMRDNGIDMPDPQMSGGAVALGMPELGDSADAIDLFSDEYITAEEACRDVLPFGDNGFGLAELDTP